MDPLAEDYESTTPYAYVENNPIVYIDPTGMYKVDSNGNITIDDRDEIENFVSFLNSNQGAAYKDVAAQVFSADRGYSNQLDEVSVIGRTAYNNGSGVRSLEARQASGAALITGAFTLGELSGGGAIGLGISGSALTATGIGAAFVGLIYASFRVNEAGYPVDARPYSQSVLGLPSMSETNGFVFSKGKGERRQAGKADGTNNPFKKLKPDPNKPGNILEKNSHTGKEVSKPAPEGFWDWWNNKR